MRDRNEEIHLFISEEDQKKNRQHALLEKAIKEWIQKQTAQLLRFPQDSFAIPEEPCKEETISLSERNQLASGRRESEVR